MKSIKATKKSYNHPDLSGTQYESHNCLSFCLSNICLHPAALFLTGQRSGAQALMRGLSWNVTGITGFLPPAPCWISPSRPLCPSLLLPKQAQSGISSSFVLPYRISFWGEVCLLHVYRWVRRGRGDRERWGREQRRNEGKTGAEIKAGRLIEVTTGFEVEETGKCVF